MDARIDALFNAYARPDSPGCAVAVLQDGHVHARGYGMADLELGVPITPATVFHIASISKQFTAFLVHLLAHEGKLSLDDDIRRHVPEVPKLGAARITLRHLLHHTSGLRDQNTMLKLAGWRPMDERTEGDILDLVRRQTTLNFRSGEDFNYCNTGYLLLSVVVSRLTGTPFRAVAEARIFRPLDMKASLVRDDHTKLVNGRARGYTPAPDGHPAFWMPNFDFAGSTSVHTTAEDLVRWADNLAHPRVGAEAVRRLTTPATLEDGRTIRYGGGVELGSYRGLDVVKHSGWDLGYMAHLAVYPRERFAVAILGNLSTLTPELLARRVADICLAEHFPAPRPEPVDLPEAALRAKTGLYRHPRTERAYWIHFVDGVLRLSPEREPASGQALRPLGGTSFLGENETTEVTIDDAGLTIQQATGVAQRLDRVMRPWKPGRRALAEYAATYRSAELDATVTFRVVKGHLVGERRKWPPQRLAAAYRDAFADDIATYVFVRNRAGTIVAVVLSLDRIFHLRFDRVRRR